MKNVFKIFWFLVLIGAVVGGVILVQKNQETRKGAAANATISTILPSAVSVIVGQNFDVHVWMNTGSSLDLLDGAEFEIAYNSAQIQYIGLTVQNGYEILNDVVNSNGLLTFKMIKQAQSTGGAIELVKITFKSVLDGSQNLVVRNAKILISGQSSLWNIPTNNLSVITINVPVAQYTLTTSATGTGAGAITGAGSYDSGTAVTVVATPNSISNFAGWSNCSTAITNPLSVTMTSDKTCTATFTRKPIDGGWGDWTPLSCPTTCGLPSSTQNRICNNPLPQFGGTCTGLPTQACAATPACACAAPTSETQTIACQAGYTGSIAQIRTKTAYPACVWGSWVTTSNTCVVVVEPTAIPTAAPTLVPTGTKILGDADGVEGVNMVDFDIWKREYLGIVETKLADWGGEVGVVDMVDFDIWKGAYLAN